MKELTRIAGALYCEAWGILPEVHARLCEQFEAKVREREELVHGREDITTAGRIVGRPIDAAPAGKADDPVGPGWRDSNGRTSFWHAQVQVLGDTAVLPVKGILGKHLSTLSMWCGGCDMALVARQAKNIAADPAVKNVVLWVDSPGGTCIGALECAEAVLAMSKAGKSTVAYTDKMAASCGYFLASACDYVMAAPSAIVGSISTFMAALDVSERYKAEGWERLVFRSGDVKGAGTPGKAWTAAEKAEAQRTVDEFSEQFKGFVSAQRKGAKPEDMQGQCWAASHAPKWLVDGVVNDIEGLLERVGARGELRQEAGMW